jgi:hypothetical protein
MNTKLTINLRDGILDVEGSDEFVRSIYEDFKGEVAKRIPLKPAGPPQIDFVPEDEKAGNSDALSKKPKLKTRSKQVPSKGQKPRIYTPKFDPDLNLDGLPEFYDKLGPVNATEKILTFAMFLKEKLQIQPCTCDQIYTCFFTVRDRTKIPEAFVQSFWNAQSRTHFIQVNSLEEIVVTIPGNNHFEKMKKRIVPK